MQQDPFARFAEVFEKAKLACTEPLDATAFTLATSTPAGRPSARVVLLKSFDTRGFVFYTNRESRKGLELRDNPVAALCFHWPLIGEQVRVVGPVEWTSDEESDAYFATRPLTSRLGAWASAQSRELSSRERLMAEVAAYGAKFALGPVPRPPHWGGYRVCPDEFEFWSDGAFRLHDRFLYKRRDDGTFSVVRLSP